MRKILVPLLLLAAACSQGTDSPVAPNPDPAIAASRAAPDGFDARREAVARQVALALRQPGFRGYVRAALDSASVDEGKVALDRFLLAGGGRGTQALREAGHGPPDDDAAARLEMYFPVPAHRAAWKGDADVLVGTIGADGTVPVAFTTDGRRITLDPQSPPTTPVLAVVPRETDFSAPRPRTRAFMTCVECDGGGSGGTSGGGSTSTGAVPPPPGLYLRGSHLNDLFESWLKGKPEIEILLLGQKGQTDSLTSYQCINENAVAPYTFNQDTKDWTGSVLLMSQAQVDNFKAAHPDQALRLFMVEDDDTPCVIKANQTDLKALIQAVDALVKGLAGGKDVSTWIGKVWKAVPVVQQIVALGSSLIKTNDDLVGNAVEDITTTERQAGYNWVVKGKNTETNGYLELEMR